MKPPGDSGKSAYHFASITGSAVRVVAIKPPQSLAETVNLIRSTGIQRVATCSGAGVVAFRGTDSQVAQAERLIQERDIAAAR